MPLPVFHSAASYSVFRVMGKTEKIRQDWKFFWLGLFLGLLPDFDFLPGLLIGNPNLFHREFSHSLCMALCVGLVVGVVYAGYKRVFDRSDRQSLAGQRRDVLSVILFSVLTYSAHLLLDYFTATGIPFVWPLSEQRFCYPLGFFMVARGHVSMAHVGGMNAFVEWILSSIYGVTLLFEVLVVLYASAFIAAMREMNNRSAYGRPVVFVRAVQVLILTTLGLFVL